MTLNKAISILMSVAERDVRGAGMRYRSTTNEWRATVSEAWTRCFCHIHKQKPRYSDYFNSGIDTPADNAVISGGEEKHE